MACRECWLSLGRHRLGCEDGAFLAEYGQPCAGDALTGRGITEAQRLRLLGAAPTAYINGLRLVQKTP